MERGSSRAIEVSYGGATLVPRLEDERLAEEIGEVILDWTERALTAVLEAYHGIATVAEGLRGGGASDRQPTFLLFLTLTLTLALTLTLTLTLSLTLSLTPTRRVRQEGGRARAEQGGPTRTRTLPQP